MITRISSYNTRPAFTGMSVRSIQNFIPGISNEAAQKLSKNLAETLPEDELTTMLTGSNYIAHSVKFNNNYYDVGSLRYGGSENIADKIKYIKDIAELIRKGTLYD